MTPEEARPLVRMAVLPGRAQEAFAAALGALRARAGVVVNMQALAKVDPLTP